MAQIILSSTPVTMTLPGGCSRTAAGTGHAGHCSTDNVVLLPQKEGGKTFGLLHDLRRSCKTR